MDAAPQHGESTGPTMATEHINPVTNPPRAAIATQSLSGTGVKEADGAIAL